MPVYDWAKAAERTSERMTPGVHRARIEKIITGKKGGAPFKSRGGDPQIMVVFTNTGAEEATQMYTLSDKAAWTMARLLSRAGVDLDDMQKQGIQPKHLANEALAASWLVGKYVWIHVEPDPRDPAKYQIVTPITEEEAKATLGGAFAGAATGKPDDDPFGDLPSEEEDANRP